jgi:hypothetical protein
MKKSRHAKAVVVLRPAEDGVPVAGLWREHGMMQLPGELLRSKHQERAHPF